MYQPYVQTESQEDENLLFPTFKNHRITSSGSGFRSFWNVHVIYAHSLSSNDSGVKSRYSSKWCLQKAKMVLTHGS